MARRKSVDEPTEDIAPEPQDEAAESQRDEVEVTDDQPGGVIEDQPEPSYAEQIGLSGDEWKDFTGKDPLEVGKALAERLTTKEQELEQRIQEAQQRWQQNLAGDPEYIMFQRHREQEAGRQPEPEKDPLADWFAPPQLDRTLIEKYVEQQPVKDEAGNIIGYEPGWKKGTPEELKKSVEDYDLYQSKWRNEFYNDPRGKLMPLVESTARKIAQEQFNNALEEMRWQEFITNFRSENGKYITDKDQFGRDVLNPLGVKLYEEANAIMADGVTNRRKAIERAWRNLRGDYAWDALVKSQETNDAKQKHESEKASASGAARRVNQRSGSLSQPENPRSPPQTESFADLLAQEFDRKGMDETYFQHLGN